MSRPADARAFALFNLDIVRQLWTEVRDGDVESVHQARIATRRIRAALNVMRGVDPDDIDRFRTIGRCLGRVRDLDVLQEHLTSYATRLPQAASAVAELQRSAAAAQHRGRRHLVKTLDDVDLTALFRRLSHPGLISSLSFWSTTRSNLLAQIARRAAALRTAIRRAPAVYMPNRLHRVRIAGKKLRYLLEIAESAGASVDPQVFRLLRKTQDTLGRMRDLQTIERYLRRFTPSSRSVADEVRLLEAVVVSERFDPLEKYRARRDDLSAISERCYTRATKLGHRRLRRAALLPAAALMTVPLALWTRSAEDDPSSVSA
jgi:CHAD domain-containing protein